MPSYEQYLQTLVEKEEKERGRGKDFLTVYFPTGNYPKDRLKQEIKSFVTTTVKRNQDADVSSRDYQPIINQIAKTIDNLDFLPNGLAFFARLDRDEFLYIPLEEVPQKEATVNSRFDLDQLVWLSDRGIDALVFQINQNEANIYAFDNSQLYPAVQRENIYNEQKAQEYIGKFSFSGYRLLFSSAEDARQKREREANKKFLKSLKSFVKKNANLAESFDYLVINWSSNFVKLNTSFGEDLKAFFPETKLLVIQKNITDRDYLEKTVGEKIRQKKITDAKRELKEAQENFDRYRKEWQPILSAANEGRIQKLFIGPVIKKQGYVVDQQYIYNYPAKNSRLVDNIAPWLVHQVLNTDGEIIVLDREIRQKIEEDAPKVAALLRY